ncbi:MAG TPA: hypothetical protein VFC99_05770 [Acidimicrobiia bacterium]|nr:hypothetical protein [Acidimicrobiia bacterium]
MKDFSFLAGRLVLIRHVASYGKVSRCHVIEIADPDPAAPDRIAYRDYGDPFVISWWELHAQLLGEGGGPWLCGRVRRVGTAFVLAPPTAAEQRTCERAYLAWSADVATLSGGAHDTVGELRMRSRPVDAYPEVDVDHVERELSDGGERTGRD